MRGWRARPLKGKNHEWTRISSIHEALPLILYIFRVFRAFRGSNVFSLLVSIRVHSWFKCFIISCPLVVQMFYLFVSFRVLSWFKYFIIFVCFVLFVV